LPDPEWAKTDAWKELEVLQGLMNEKDINEAKGLCAEMRSSRNSPPSIGLIEVTDRYIANQRSR
jgi:pentatricopeptide repeat protein